VHGRPGRPRHLQYHQSEFEKGDRGRPQVDLVAGDGRQVQADLVVTTPGPLVVWDG
jgi:hypothetical protein